MYHSVSELFTARDGIAALSFVSSWQPHSIEQVGLTGPDKLTQVPPEALDFGFHI